MTAIRGTHCGLAEGRGNAGGIVPGDVNGSNVSSGEAQLVISGVSKHFGGVRAVEAVTLSVRTGELISVIGPNGAGKTSLLNMISGFYRPDTGAIVFAGKDI